MQSHQSIFVIMTAGFLLLCYTSIPVATCFAEDKQSSQPDSVVVFVEIPYHASAQENDTCVAQVVELSLMHVKELTEVFTASDGERVILMAIFPATTDWSKASCAVRKAIDESRMSLPTDIGPPEIKSVPTDVEPSAWVVLKSSKHGLSELGYIAQNVAWQCQMIPNTVYTRIAGSTPPRITVRLSDERLRVLYMESMGVIDTIKQYHARFLNEPLTSDNDVMRMLQECVLNVQNGSKVRLADVATLEYGAAPPRTVVHWSGQPVVAVGLIPEPDISIPSWTQEIQRITHRLRRELSEHVELETVIVASKKPAHWITIDCQMPAESTLEQTVAMTSHISIQIKGQAQAILSLTEPSSAVIHVLTADRRLGQEMRMVLERQAGVRVGMRDALRLSPFVPPYRIGLRIEGPDIGTLWMATQNIAEMLIKSGLLTDVLLPQPAPEVCINVHRERAAMLGLSVERIKRLLSMIGCPTTIGMVRVADRSSPLLVEMAGSPGSHTPDWRHWCVRNSDGKLIPIDQVVEVQLSLAHKKIFRHNGRFLMIISGQPGSGLSASQSMDQCCRTAWSVVKNMRDVQISPIPIQEK